MIDQVVVTSDSEFELIPRVGAQRILIGDGTALDQRFEKLRIFYEKGIPQVGLATLCAHRPALRRSDRLHQTNNALTRYNHMDHNQEIVAGLDIGTTKIACIVGRKNEQGKIEILGMGKAKSDGVSRGVVANIQKTVESIKAAIREAGDSAGVDIETVNVGIAGQHIRSMQHRGMKMRESLEEEITPEGYRSC